VYKPSFLNPCRLLHELLQDREMLPIAVYQQLHNCSHGVIHGTADNVQAVVGWPGLIPCLTVLWLLLQLPTHRNTLLWRVAASPHTASWWHLFLPKQQCYTPLSLVYDSTPLTDTIVPQKWSLCHPLVPYIGWMLKRPLPHNMCISWMAKYFCLHITSMSVNHLWMALVEQECWDLILYIFLAIDAHK
jgi:hypothetical protein